MKTRENEQLKNIIVNLKTQQFTQQIPQQNIIKFEDIYNNNELNLKETIK